MSYERWAEVASSACKDSVAAAAAATAAAGLT